MHFPLDRSFDPPLSVRSIFAVEESEVEREAFRAALNRAGVSNPCRFFPNGEKMIDALFSVLRGAPPPLLCFLETSMDGMCGLDVLRWIRLQDILMEVSIVMLGPSATPDLLSEVSRCGAQCYAKKFPDAEQLQEIVSEARKFAEASSGQKAFDVPCNLLRTAEQPAT